MAVVGSFVAMGSGRNCDRIVGLPFLGGMSFPARKSRILVLLVARLAADFARKLLNLTTDEQGFCSSTRLC